ncbi:hypothetical protein BC937DRAFT_91975 [Endogone sp. FLAS-F59071]|nr:hypothetical protein BC937DRAFT_91975 [Endogone sp. FLAS-F59071]|eukprot:RUS15805.1 hypothetical protein BC937DRAFT_91975 [Endogone sp. FLAS-F59071]
MRQNNWQEINTDPKINNIKYHLQPSTQFACGYITDDTRIIFRSESAKYFIFLQMSKEMWDFDEDGELFFEKAVQSFLPELFRKWSEHSTNHIVSIILFSRVFYSDRDKPEVIGDHALHYDEEGRLYRDFYKVIADWETRTDWTTVIVPLKKEFIQYQREILMRQDSRGYPLICGRNSLAFDGNVLEAVNLALNPFDKHYFDRDLMRTGLSIMMITPGSGKFKVDRKLLRLTTERMTDNGIAMDLVCLSKVPLHLVPLFIFLAKEPKDYSGKDGDETAPTTPTSTKQFQFSSIGMTSITNPSTNGAAATKPKINVWDPLYFDEDDSVASPAKVPNSLANDRNAPLVQNPLVEGLGITMTVDANAKAAEILVSLTADKAANKENLRPLQTFYMMPHWVDTSFYMGPTGRFIKPDKYVPRCKMYEMQMMGIMEHEIATISIPYLEEDEVIEDKDEGGNDANGNDGNGDDPEIVGPEKNDHNLPHQKAYSLISKTSCSTHELDYDAYDEAVFAPEGPNAKRLFNFQPIAPIIPVMSASSVRAPGSIAPGTPSNRRSLDAGELLKDDGRVVDLETKLSRSAPKTSFWSFSNFRSQEKSVQQPSADGFNMQNPLQGENGGMETHFNKQLNVNAAPPYATLSGRRPVDTVVSVPDLLSTSSVATESERPGKSILVRRNTSNSMTTFSQETGKAADDDDAPAMSSTTVKAMPIPNNPREHRRTISTSTQDPTPSSGTDDSFPPSVSGSLTSTTTKDRSSKIATPAAARAPPARASITNKLAPRQSTTINPSNPSRNVSPFTSHLRRWQHALPKPIRTEAPIVHWHSMCTPACLPLTTDYFPPSEELSELYEEFAYIVSVGDEVNLYQAGDESDQKKNEKLLVELISQRLSQGFQLIVPTAVAQHAKRPSVTTTKDFNMDGSEAYTNGLPVIGSGGTDNVPSSGIISKDYASTPYYLSMGHQVHKLSFNTDQNVEVKRYVRLLTYNPTSMSYSCAIWPRQLDEYKSKDVTFSYPTKYPWNYLDHLVAGYEQELTENLRYWRARFILIPAESPPAPAATGGLTGPGPLSGPGAGDLDDEELRMEYFRTFLQVFKKAEWLSPKEYEEMKKKKKRELNLDLGLAYTTMDPAAHIWNEVRHARAAAEASPRRTSITSLGSQLLTRDAPLHVITAAMLHPVTGIKMRNTRWHVRIFENVFLGNEFAEWLIREFADIDTREDAVVFGNQLMEKGLFEHSLKRHKFFDGHYFYQLKGENATRQWFISPRRPTASLNPMPSPTISSVSDKTTLPETMASPRPSSSTSSMTELKSDQPMIELKIEPMTELKSDQPMIELKNDLPREFEMSKMMIIDLDEKKRSNRRETAILHYDAVHNARNCYHFQINWLGCTSQLINELLHSWSGKAERCGLKLVEASVDQAYAETENDNPFQCPVPIKLALSPPDIRASLQELHPQFEVPYLYFETELVKYHKFVLDVEADGRYPKGVDLKYTYTKTEYRYDQYVHISGVSFIQIAPSGEGFFWVNNRLFTSHTPALQLPSRSANAPTFSTFQDSLRQSFEEFCSDPDRLKKFWDDSLNKLSTRPGMKWILENQPEVVAVGLDIDETPEKEEAETKILEELDADYGKEELDADYGKEELNERTE